MNQNSFSSGYLLITNFDDGIKNLIEKELGETYRVWFHFDNLLIDGVHKIVEESYTSEINQKVVIIETKKMSGIVQNSLLKILEEPPKNLSFILIVPSKSLVLPTIRSRMPLRIIKNEKKSSLSIQLPKLRDLNLQNLNSFLKTLEKEKLSASENREVLEQIFKTNLNYQFSKEDIERFQISSQLLQLHSNPSRTILMALLPIAISNN
jgi:DNA polymerase-3 subunit delta'